MSEELQRKIQELEKENRILKEATRRWEQIQKLYEESNDQLRDAERTLSQANDRLELSIEAGNIACWDWDYKTGKVFYTENRASLLGYQSKELPKSFGELTKMIHPDDYDSAMEKLNLHLKGDCPWYEAEFRLQNKSGEWKWFLDKGKISERDILGNPIRVAGVLFEMDARKNNEKDLKDAMLKSDADNRSKSLFLASMSHEIYTPMAGVIGMAQILKQSKLSQEQSEYLDVITKSATNLMSILNDILEYSKIEAGKVEFHDKPFSIHQVVEEVASSLADRAIEKNIEILSFLDPYLPNEAVGDPVRLRQVLKIFTDNALKFTEKGEVRVEAEFVEWDDEMVRVRFNIIDTGIGISEAGMKKLFSSFSKQDSPESKKYSGGGLGLAIAKHLIDRMNGLIKVDSVPGSGTTFSILLDFDRYKDSEAPDGMKDIIKGLKVLIIDPQPLHAGLLGNYFERWNCEVEISHDPHVALLQIRHQAEIKRPYQLLVVEQNMGVINGLQFADLVKKDPLIRQSEILLTSSRLAPVSSAEMTEAGIKAGLIRPYTLSRLKNRILEAVSMEKTGISGFGQEGETEPPVSRKKVLNILLAEDNLINQKVALVTLEKIGHRTDLAENGKIAVEMFSRNVYDLVLMDIFMPEMDGLEATREIRAIESAAKNREPVYICAITANTSSEDEEKCFSAGMNGYITKPFKLEELNRVLSLLY